MNTTYPKLIFIFLRNNTIREIHEKTFMALQNVLIIVLDNNAIISISKYLFSYNTQLKYINLNNNLLTNIPRNIFINNTKLVGIQLINNKIKHFIIKSNTLRDLKHLYLHGNPLDSLDEDTFKPLLIRHYNNLKITFDTYSFTCYSMLCNMSWMIDRYSRNSIYELEYKTIINSMLVYDKYEGTELFRIHGIFNSDNNDLYNYLHMRKTNCSLQGNCSTS